MVMMVSPSSAHPVNDGVESKVKARYDVVAEAMLRYSSGPFNLILPLIVKWPELASGPMTAVPPMPKGPIR